MKIWRQAGKLLRAAGKIIRCAVCPCGTVTCVLCSPTKLPGTLYVNLVIAGVTINASLPCIYNATDGGWVNASLTWCGFDVVVFITCTFGTAGGGCVYGVLQVQVSIGDTTSTFTNVLPSGRRYYFDFFGQTVLLTDGLCGTATDITSCSPFFGSKSFSTLGFLPAATDVPSTSTGGPWCGVTAYSPGTFPWSVAATA